MYIAELKKELIEKIMETNDIALLLELELLLIEKGNDTKFLNEHTTSYEQVRVFSSEEERKLNFAIQQYENGECISDEEAQKEIQDFLEEVHVFTPEQRKRVLNSLEQSKKGNTMTDEKAQADIQKWL